MIHKRGRQWCVVWSLPWLLAIAVACGNGGGGRGHEGMPAGEITVPATFTIRPGVEQVAVMDAEPFAPLTLYRAGGGKLVTLVTDAFGQASFIYVPEEHGVYETGPDAPIPQGPLRTLKAGMYVIRNESLDPVEATEPFRVLHRAEIPSDSFYDAQVLNEGYQYLEVRDGTKLSVAVHFPDSSLWGPAPWPTVVNYSGYSPSDPDNPAPGMFIGQLAGYAAVGVNVRGTGCSGGVFDPFGTAQQADGYDVIEVVARQPWVLHNRVGMVGISFPGIMQLYVASTRPPHLAAIAPLSVIEDPWRQQWPGGVYNQGFTRNWLAGLDGSAAPFGPRWVRRRVENGDTVCEEHQDLRNQNIPFEPLARTLEFYPPDADDRRLSLLVSDIEVPVFLTGAWQDEQTGPRFATMLDDFVSTDRAKFTLFNGHHPDGYSPLVITRLWEFLEFNVHKEIPRLPWYYRLLIPFAMEEMFGAPIGFERDRFRDYSDYAEALAAYEAERPVRVLFESGAGHLIPGAHKARFEASFEEWPPPEAQPATWYLGPHGNLLDEPAASNGIDAYEHDPEAGDLTYYAGGDWTKPLIEFDWPPPAEGSVLSYLTAPLDENVVVVGNGGYTTLWFATDENNATVEVTITEVRPDGIEFLVQSGVLRIGHHHVVEARSSGEFLIDYTYHQEDFEPPLPGEFQEIRVPIRPFAHPFRKRSRIRLIVSTPGRDAPLWSYENPDYGGRRVFNRVARDPARPSSLVLPVVEGIEVPRGYPPCPSLRGQVCRTYVSVSNLASGTWVADSCDP